MGTYFQLIIAKQINDENNSDNNDLKKQWKDFRIVYNFFPDNTISFELHTYTGKNLGQVIPQLNMLELHTLYG